MTTAMKKRTRAEAKKLMWEYYRDNKEFLPTWIRECREEVLERLLDGVEPEDAYESVTKSVELNTETPKAA
jgi:hypothetical protein